MIVLYILGGLILIICLLLFLKLTFRFSWCNGILLEAKIGFITFRKEFKPLAEIEEDEETPEEMPNDNKAVSKTHDGEIVSFRQVLPIIKETLSFFVKKLKKHLKLEKYIVKINVATDDPAKTAILYGGVSAAASSLQTYVDTLKNVSSKKGRISTVVTPDFISEKTDIFVDISLSVRVWQGLSLLKTLAGGYKKYKLLKSGKEE